MKSLKKLTCVVLAVLLVQSLFLHISLTAMENKPVIKSTRGSALEVIDWTRERYLGPMVVPSLQFFHLECVPGYCVETQYKSITVPQGYTVELDYITHFWSPNPARPNASGIGYYSYYYDKYVYKTIPNR